MPRPSLERTLKYIPVVPSAQKKLGREARRESHDLRKLVGHANLLDTLMKKLDFGEAEEETEVNDVPAASSSSSCENEAVWKGIDLANDAQWASDYSNSSSEDEEELITPNFDDDNENLDLTLTRTTLKRAAATPVKALPMFSPIAEHPLQVGAPQCQSTEERIDDVLEVDKHIQVPSLEEAESYFGDVDISQERANVVASLVTFDTGTTLSTAGST